MLIVAEVGKGKEGEHYGGEEEGGGRRGGEVTTNRGSMSAWQRGERFAQVYTAGCVCPQNSAWTPERESYRTSGHVCTPVLHKHQLSNRSVSSKKVNDQASTQSRSGAEVSLIAAKQPRIWCLRS